MKKPWRDLLAPLALTLLMAPAFAAQEGGLHSFDLPGEAGRFHYYASSGSAPTVTSALVILHGHPRDARRSFDAALQAAGSAGRLPGTLIVAPLYQVPNERAGRCQSPGEPTAVPGDAVWSCSGWIAGEPSLGAHPVSAFSALDALLVELHRQWPDLRNITLVGFSAGAQMLQHSIGFAAEPPAGITLRYVIADPGSWLYFDPVRPTISATSDAYDFSIPPASAGCPGYNQWKYGTESLPAWLPRSAAQARARYAAAQVDYLEGELDGSAAKGAFYPILDKSCAAMLQGPFRLQRGVAYAAYEKALIKPVQPRRLVVVPGCGHDVRCVLNSEAAGAVLWQSPSP